MKKITKQIILIILVSIILNFCFVIIKTNHHCTHDDNCEICTIINNIKENLKTITPSIIKIIIIKEITHKVIKTIKEKYKYALTLINLKVQLNN